MSWNEGPDAGATGWENSSGGAASPWNDNAGGVATNDNNFGETGGDNFNDRYGGDARGEDGASSGSCRRCGQDGHFANVCDQVRLDLTRTLVACAKSFSHVRWELASTAVRKAIPRQNVLDLARLQARAVSAKRKDRSPSYPKVQQKTNRTLLIRLLNAQSANAGTVAKKVMMPWNVKRVCVVDLLFEYMFTKSTDRLINLQHIADKTEGAAWKAVEQASNERDITDFKEAVQVLVKACPELTYPQLEKEFRKRDFNIYLVALEKDHGDTFTSVNLQGELGKKFVVGYFLSDKAQRPSMKGRWPKSSEENLRRLEDAGVPMDRGVPKCSNCNELGHMSRSCPEEKREVDRVKVSCALCGADGHRARDCEDRPPPRPGKECRVCQSTEHQAKDCPNGEKRTCRGSEDHIAKECDQPRNLDTIQCRNCDKFGHTSRDCTAPKDWSKVKCNNCGEMGHTVKRCKKPVKEEADEATDNDGVFGGETGGGGWEQPSVTGDSGQPEWENNNADASAFTGEAPVTVSGWGW